MDYLRTKVSGAKNRFIDDKFNLDLSYITPRLIAMAYPASGFESLYRNHVDDVANFLSERHNSDFLIINLSGKKYDNNKFFNKVNTIKYNFLNRFKNMNGLIIMPQH